MEAVVDVVVLSPDEWMEKSLKEITVNLRNEECNIKIIQNLLHLKILPRDRFSKSDSITLGLFQQDSMDYRREGSTDNLRVELSSLREPTREESGTDPVGSSSWNYSILHALKKRRNYFSDM